jgi:hypothetical protein
MKKNKIILPVFIALFFWGSSFSQKKNPEDIKWSGTINYKSIYRQEGSDSSTQMKTEWNNLTETAVNASFVNNGGHAGKTEKSNNWLKTTFEVNPKNVQVEKRTTDISCNCNDTSEVKVEIVDMKEIVFNNKKITEATHKYWITSYAGPCTGNETTTYANSNLQAAGIPITTETKKMECQEVQINIPEQPLGKDPTHLVGTTGERRSVAGGGTWEITISWDLNKVK